MTTLIGYEPLRADALIGALASHAADPSAANAERLARVLVGVESGVPYAGAIAVLGTESPLARIARHGIGERHRRILARELGILADLAHQDLRTVLDVHGLGDYAPEESGTPVSAPGLPVATAALARRMAETRDWSALADEVATEAVALADGTWKDLHAPVFGIVERWGVKAVIWHPGQVPSNGG